jgi:hypothetical protein
VERVRGKRVLVDTTPTTQVEHRNDLPVGVDLDGCRHGVRPGGIDEVRERDDPLVTDPARVEGNAAREVALLDPELWCRRKLADEEANDLVARQRPARRGDPKVLLGDVLDE